MLFGSSDNAVSLAACLTKETFDFLLIAYGICGKTLANFSFHLSEVLFLTVFSGTREYLAGVSS